MQSKKNQETVSGIANHKHDPQSRLQEMWDAGSEHAWRAGIGSRKGTKTKDPYMEVIASNAMHKQCLT